MSHLGDDWLTVDSAGGFSWLVPNASAAADGEGGDDEVVDSLSALPQSSSALLTHDAHSELNAVSERAPDKIMAATTIAAHWRKRVHASEVVSPDETSRPVCAEHRRGRGADDDVLHARHDCLRRKGCDDVLLALNIAEGDTRVQNEKDVVDDKAAHVLATQPDPVSGGAARTRRARGTQAGSAAEKGRLPEVLLVALLLVPMLLFSLVSFGFAIQSRHLAAQSFTLASQLVEGHAGCAPSPHTPRAQRPAAQEVAVQTERSRPSESHHRTESAQPPLTLTPSPTPPHVVNETTGNAEEEAECTAERSSALPCSRPSNWCIHVGAVYSDTVDCDGDDVADPLCDSVPTTGEHGFLGSASGCTDKWGPASANNACDPKSPYPPSPPAVEAVVDAVERTATDEPAEVLRLRGEAVQLRAGQLRLRGEAVQLRLELAAARRRYEESERARRAERDSWQWRLERQDSSFHKALNKPEAKLHAQAEVIREQASKVTVGNGR